MRFAVLFLLVGLSSCSPAAVLYTDELFRASAPEVVKAWQGLSPFHNAQTVNLPAGSGLATLLAAQGALAAPPIALVGVALSASDRRDLVNGLHNTKVVFLGAGLPGEASIGVNPSDAWQAAARAAGPSGGAATVLYPPEASSADRDAFSQTWHRSGGGTLTSWVWPESGDWSSVKTFFQWAGPEADSRVAALGAAVTVYANPGATRAPGSHGLTWKIRETGLGDFLWQAALAVEKKPHFLPLETVPAGLE